MLFSRSIFLSLIVSLSACGNGAESDDGASTFEIDFQAAVFPTNVRFTLTDYPEGVEDDYEIRSGFVDLPSSVGTGRGFLVTHNNHSDDIDSHVIVELGPENGIEPSTKYRVTSKFTFYSNAPTGCFGVGGSPDAVAFRVCGSTTASSIERVLDDHNQWRLPATLDASTPCDREVGSIGTAATDCTGDNPWTLQTRMSAPFEIVSNAEGKLFVLLSTHSGFEATSTWYYRHAQFTLELLE